MTSPTQPGTAWCSRGATPQAFEQQCDRARNELATALRVDPSEIDLIVSDYADGQTIRAYWWPWQGATT